MPTSKRTRRPKRKSVPRSVSDLQLVIDDKGHMHNLSVEQRLAALEAWVQRENEESASRTKLVGEAGRQGRSALEQVALLERFVDQFAETLRWTCEECGAKNRLPLFLAGHIEWICEHCQMKPLIEYRAFCLQRARKRQSERIAKVATPAERAYAHGANVGKSDLNKATFEHFERELNEYQRNVIAQGCKLP